MPAIEPLDEDEYRGAFKIRADYDVYRAFFEYAQDYRSYEQALRDLLEAADTSRSRWG